MGSHRKTDMSDAKLLGEKIKGIRIAMMTTCEGDELHSRPMATLDEDFDGDLWFFTYATAPKVSEVAARNQVNLSYTKEADNVYVSISGTAELVQDRKKIKSLWKPFLKAWFPNGEDDPNVTLLKVHVENAEIWDAPSGKMGRLYSTLKSLATGARDSATNDIKLDMK